MKKSTNYIFLDGIFSDYMAKYGIQWEQKLVKEFKKYLALLSKTSKIMIITNQDISKVTLWLLKYNLNLFVYNVSNPVKSNFI
jgi:hypothetical protein